MAKSFKKQNEQRPEGPIRVKMPNDNQIIGIISQRLGAGRMYVSCMDGKTRNCRVPGGKRRGLWLREGDVILVEPWEHDNDKADVVYKYPKGAIPKLKKRGMLETSDSEF